MPSSSTRSSTRFPLRLTRRLPLWLRRWLPPLVAARCWGAVWMLVSHRALRWTTASALAVLLTTNVILLDRGPLYALTLGGQAAFFMHRRGTFVRDLL